MNRIQSVLEKYVNSKTDNLHGVMEKLISESQAVMKKELEKTVKEMNHTLDLEVGILSSRTEAIELKIAKKVVRKKYVFDPDVSLIIVGLPHTENEDLMTLGKDLREGLQCDPVPHPVAVEHTRTRGCTPGLVKVELQLVQDKVAVLRRKAQLKSHDCYQRVYVSAAKAHIEWLLYYNFRTLLRETSAGKDFYVARNGRLVKRAPMENAAGGGGRFEVNMPSL
ncbi:hypothetical protein ABVT39_016182 [Epinephelus coioides]